MGRYLVEIQYGHLTYARHFFDTKEGAEQVVDHIGEIMRQYQEFGRNDTPTTIEVADDDGGKAVYSAREVHHVRYLDYERMVVQDLELKKRYKAELDNAPVTDTTDR